MLLLVPSPLLGPSSWERAAHALDERGRNATVGVATPPVDTPHPWWEHAADDLARQVTRLDCDQVALVGHSGAGPRLPAFGAALAQAGVAPSGYVFVDAGLPTPGLSAREALPEPFRAQLAQLTDADGLLPPWIDWWGEDLLAGLGLDPVARHHLEADCWPTPASLFDEVVPVPRGWHDAPCAYLALSDAYAEDASDAERRGWACRRRHGGHLDVLTEPDGVADAIVELCAVAGIP